MALAVSKGLKDNTSLIVFKIDAVGSMVQGRQHFGTDAAQQFTV
jgi:hypothetical protein